MSNPLPSIRPLPAGMLAATFVFGLWMPLSALAELSLEPLLGPALRSRPAYDGAADRHTEWVPVLRYYGQPWFARSTQGLLEGGARIDMASGLHAGVQMAYEPGRQSSQSALLSHHRFPDIDPGASLGAHVEWDHQFGRMPIALLVRARQHTDRDRGAQLDFRLSAGVFQHGRVAAGVFTQLTWAKAKSAGAVYDITPQQSATTGLPAFAAGSGWLFASYGVLWSVDLSRRWIVVGSMESRHLRGDSARSPLAERRSNVYASAGLAYRF